MKAYLQIALLAIFIIGINGVEICNEVKGSDDDECLIHPTNINYTHCCYYSTDNYAGCMEITDDQYENIKRFKKYMKEHYESYSGFKIKCSGEFVTYSLFVLLALLF